MAHIADAHHRSRFSSKPPLPEQPIPGGSPAHVRPLPHSPRTPPHPPSAIATAAWSHVSLSCIGDLPPSTGLDGQRCCTVVTFLDRLTRQARFLPASETPSAGEVAALFSTHVQGRFGPPKVLLWDRDLEPGAPSEAEQAFWRQLCTLLHVPVSPLPQPDAAAYGGASGALFATRRVIEQLIRGHAHELHDNWAAFLHLAEAAFNGAHPTTLSATQPFFLARSASGLLGPGLPHAASAPATPRGSRDASSNRSSPAAVQFMQLREILVRDQQELQEARARYGSYGFHRSSSGGYGSSGSSRSSGGGGGTDGGGSGGSSGGRTFARSNSCGGGSSGGGSCSAGGSTSNSSGCSTGSGTGEGASSSSSNAGSPTPGAGPARHCDPRFSVGDRVRLSTTHLVLPDQPGVRLRPGFLGPFTIVDVVSPAAYRLELPPSLGRLHPVFHVSRLLAWTEPETRIPPLSPRLAASTAGVATAAVSEGSSSPLAAQCSGLRVASFSDGEAGSIGGVVTGVRVGQVGRLLPTVMFRIRWSAPRADGREDVWEPYSAVQQLPAVRAYLRSSEWRAWKRTDAAQQFSARWPDRMPRLVRFEV